MNWFNRIFEPKTGPHPNPDDQRYDIEYLPALISEPCECCGNETTVLKRTVSRDGSIHGACMITYTACHPEIPARAIIHFGISRKEGSAITTFGMTIQPGGIAFIDVGDGNSSDPDDLCTPLSRKEALEHPDKPAILRIIDQLYEDDKVLIDYFTELQFQQCTCLIAEGDCRN
ncbi:MAG: hypothetical protein CFE26_18320 [Verrucomicrobiales bacterium VVV1]|nr:MAG: hypothetical protein CFE26_18320 [Verrucomicrobiales bacterium VVV1]